jgi:predicted O-methyltransferase YrrM
MVEDLARLDELTDGVPWTPTRTCHLFHALASSYASPSILEVSCGFGKATAYFAVAAARAGGMVWAVDSLRPRHEDRSAADLVDLAGASDHCRTTFNCDARWFLLDLLRSQPDLRFDLAYIDCSHTVEVDAFVALAAWTHLRPNGLVVFDDLAWVPAVQDPAGRGYSRPDESHVRILFEYVRSLPDVDEAVEWDDAQPGWPLGIVGKAGGERTGRLVTGLLERFAPA